MSAPGEPPLWRRIVGDPVSCFALVLVTGLLAAAVGAPWVAPSNPRTLHSDALFAGSSWAHLLGTDQGGRDVLSRLVYGTRWSLGTALLVTVLVTVIGVGVGAVSGFVGGIVDTVAMRVVDALLAFPTLLLALAIVAVVGRGMGGVLLALVSVGWAASARIVRGLVQSLRERPYVEAARAAGARDRRILGRHILPQVLSPVIVLATLEVGQLILALAGLSFLGLGVKPDTPEWGSMINENRIFLFRAPRLMVYPGIAITLAVLGFNLLGDRLRDILDPRLGPVGRDVSS